MPQIKIDFYQVYLPDDFQGSFEEILSDLNSRPPADRLSDRPDGWVQLKDLTSHSPFLTGIILKAKADEIPPAANRAAVVEDLTLQPDQGIAGITHFYYRPSNAVFLLQRNYRGVRAPTFENYVSEISGVDVELRPVLQQQAIEKLRRFRKLRKISLKIATPHAAIRQSGVSLTSMIRLMDHHGAPEAEVTLSMGRRRGSLKHNPVLETVQRILRFGEQADVRKVVAFGAEHEDERISMLDLIHDKMFEVADVSLEGRRLSDSSCAAEIAAAYDRRRREITRIIGS